MKILTFDIEEWFLSTSNKRNPPSSWGGLESRVEKNTDTILGMLDAKNTRATFYVLGWIAQQYPGLVRRIADSGHDIGYHTFFHQHLSEFSPETFGKDLQGGVGLLEDLTGVKVTTFRAPFFALTDQHRWMYDQLINLGIKTSSSVKAGEELCGKACGNGPVLLSHVGEDFVEFPLNSVNFYLHRAVFSGGGYFRILPLWLLKKLFARENYIMAYFHPRDFDAALPYSGDVSFMRNIRNLAGVGSGLRKLEWMLDTYDFVTIEKAHRDMVSRHV